MIPFLFSIFMANIPVMNAIDIKKELHEYIEDADGNQLKAIYEILRVAENEEDYQISDEHKRIIDERLKAYYANPNDVLTWEEVKAKYQKQ